MKITKVMSILGGSSLAIVLASGTVLAQDEKPSPPKAPSDHAQMSDMHDMSSMHGMHGMKMTGDQDYDFAAMMRKHHEMGLQISKRNCARVMSRN